MFSDLSDRTENVTRQVIFTCIPEVNIHVVIPFLIIFIFLNTTSVNRLVLQLHPKDASNENLRIILVLRGFIHIFCVISLALAQ